MSAVSVAASGSLADFAAAGVLVPADVHVATRLAALAGETDEAVLLAVALAVRSTRHGSVVLDLATAEQTTSPDEDVDAEPVVLPWPGADWAARVAASPLVGGPLRVEGSRVWLARYWHQEEQVAEELLARTDSAPDDLDESLLQAALARLFPKVDDADQRVAAELCARHRVSVLAGGPGTGKTTTVSRLLALLLEQHPTWRVALAAPTGKAAVRLEEAVRASSATLDSPARDQVQTLRATTLHRLLGWRPDARSRFRHDRHDRLPVDVLVVDEASMLPLTMMARLLEALRPATRVILVGDPDQLASVEAGAVLGDVAASTRLAGSVARLTSNRRFASTGPIARLARAVQDGEAAAALQVLRSGDPSVQFVEVADDDPVGEDAWAGIRTDALDAGRALLAAARVGDLPGALEAVDRHRLLCAHRTGPRGVQRWSGLVQRWLEEELDLDVRPDGRYVGEPLLVTENDAEIGLFNGDTGAVVERRDGIVGAFGRGGAPVVVPLARLGAVRPLHAMTVHRSQGSQFARVSLVLPPASSPLGTRETLYTALTRAIGSVRVIGSEEAVVAAVERTAARATGLRERLG
ncbi:DNA helicase/exodeoxyribonuclease V alpha subunit [Motilibacter rhizosphaerae]|uniref:RecBCD enzyme subunit RecD n=1 Tax=Motilibacter rhizosphaerae TaxID=598652 RepID=A0A4Q7NP52_9ACTN|nr:exodeoxyribonuclease V subunit alpha [Motilibacter rhizosphaerae]RZS86862.1 DNA helicase/exodeoxyribonuclease V alpha subunit [Motilibacter rhizosphaerae]